MHFRIPVQVARDCRSESSALPWNSQFSSCSKHAAIFCSLLITTVFPCGSSKCMTVGLATNRLLLDMQSASVYKEKRNSGAIKINTFEHAWVSKEIGLYLNDRSRKTIEIIKIATLLVITITFHSHVSFIPPFSLNLLYFSIPF